MKHLCVRCRAPAPAGFHPFCAACGGMIDVEYDLHALRLPSTANPYVRFAPLLPLVHAHERLPVAEYTPLIHATRLGRELGLKWLYLKDETRLPTRTTKDRMAAVALAYLHERGVRRFSASSTGNSSTSFAHRIGAFPDMHLFLFTAETFVPRVQHADGDQVTHFGMRDASFVEAAEYSSVYARAHGLTAEGGFFNPGRREGLKLAFLEASEQAPRPIDWYVQAVSSAMGVYGAYKGARELLQLGLLPRLPRLMCVQQRSCAPMVHAYREGSPAILPHHRVARPEGIAEAILRGDPTRAYPYIRGIVDESGGTFAAVDEAEIRAARGMLAELEGIEACYSASAALAGVVQTARAGDALSDALVVVNLTGADRPEGEPSRQVEWLSRGGSEWTAEQPQ